VYEGFGGRTRGMHALHLWTRFLVMFLCLVVFIWIRCLAGWPEPYEFTVDDR